MSMNVGSPDGDEGTVISTINTTPLVDVMLVMLIIFLITIPVVTTSIQLQLPKESIEVRETKPDSIILSVDRDGAMYWYDSKVPDARSLVERLSKVASRSPQPEVQIRGDLDANYESVGKIIYACQRAGITKVAFITEPPARGN